VRIVSSVKSRRRCRFPKLSKIVRKTRQLPKFF
jgi:hypothetical protein